MLFQVGGLTVYSYGVMLAVGFIVATLVARYRFKLQYKNPDIILDFVLAAVVGGIVGARLFYVIGNWSEFRGHLGKIFSINMSGLVFYGGLVLGLALVVAVGFWKKVKFWSIMDLAGLCLPLGLAFGRVGCFLNGCCYGKPTTLPWGITFPTVAPLVARHPTQLYELVLDLGLFAFLWWKRDSFSRDGTAFWLFALGYGSIRFFMEFLRDHTAAHAGLAFQMMSLALILAAVGVLLFRYRVLPAASSEAL
ncbi:MAG TPA: prolipoprotein diacylglyceryl transferase [Candidatus Anoxymicrobiaceae bacterium]